MNSLLKPVILVADVDSIALDQTVSVFNPRDFRVFTADCRESALVTAQTVQLDLLLLDLAVDAMDVGHNLIEEIHSIPDQSEVPVIFTSAGQVPDVIHRQHGFGGAYHIRKPFDPTVMITLVERALWMPHLVQSHVSRPHFNMAPTTTAARILTSAEWSDFTN